MLQAWLVIAPSSKNYTFSSVLFHKYGRSNVVVIIYMFDPTKATVKLANGNTVQAKGIGIISCRFPNWPILYPVGPVYYYQGYPSNTITLDELKCCVGFQKVTSEPLEHCYFAYPWGRYWRSLYQTQTNLDYLQIKIVKVNPQRDRNLFFPNISYL